MSCDGNRAKHFRAAAAEPSVAAALGAGDAERSYQALDAIYDAASHRSDTPAAVADALTRLMFAQMRQAGLTPPTHTSDSLPKLQARQGYAAVMKTITAARSGREIPASAHLPRVALINTPALEVATHSQLEAYGGRRTARSGPDRVAITIGGVAYVVEGADFTTMKDAVKDYVQRCGTKPAVAFDRTAKTWNVPGTLTDAQAAFAPYTILSPSHSGGKSSVVAPSSSSVPSVLPPSIEEEEEMPEPAAAPASPLIAGRRVSPAAPSGSIPAALQAIIDGPLHKAHTYILMHQIANGKPMSMADQVQLDAALKPVAADIQALYRRKTSDLPLVVWAREYTNSQAKRHAFSVAILSAGGTPRCSTCGQWMARAASGHYCPSSAFNVDGFNGRGINRRGITRWQTDKDGNPVVRRRTVEEAADDLIIKSDPIDNPAMADLWGRVASAVAGHDCIVVLRPGGFATDMKGTIYADPYPLGRDADPRHNLIVTKAGIYHEIGHELTTPPEDWAYLLEVAAGKQTIPGIDKGSTFITKMYNIIEDGRMERDMATRFPGVAETLEAQCAIYPRWGEEVGPGVELADEVIWPLLYTALPYFAVRNEVRAAMTPEGRALFEELEPIARFGVQGTPEDSLAATIEITKRLEAAGVLDVPATTATPPPPPPAGTKARSGPPSDERQEDGDTESTPSEKEQSTGTPEQPAQANATDSPDDEEQDEGEAAESSPRTDEEAPTEAVGSAITAERLEDILNDLESAAVSTLDREAVRQGRYDALGGLLHTPLGNKVTLKPVEDGGKPGDGPQQRYRTPDGTIQRVATYLPKVTNSVTLSGLTSRRPAQREIAGRLARKLNSIRQEAQTRFRYETKGTLDRRRFVAALRDAENVRTRTETTSETGMAVSVLLDQSGSMYSYIRSGQLYDATCIMGQSFEELGMPYEVRGHGGASTQYKAMDDSTLDPQRAASLMSDSSGSNMVTAPVVGLALTSLLGRPDPNKLIVNLMDGDMEDLDATAQQYAEARKQGIVTFGVFLGNPHSGQQASMDRYFGRGNWRQITTLTEMPAVIGKRIADIFDALGGDE